MPERENGDSMGDLTRLLVFCALASPFSAGGSGDRQHMKGDALVKEQVPAAAPPQMPVCELTPETSVVSVCGNMFIGSVARRPEYLMLGKFGLVALEVE